MSSLYRAALDDLDAMARNTDWDSVVADRPARDNLVFRRRILLNMAALILIILTQALGGPRACGCTCGLHGTVTGP